MIVFIKKPLDENELMEISFIEPTDIDNWEKLYTQDHLAKEIQDNLINLAIEFKRKNKRNLSILAMQMAKEIGNKTNSEIITH